MRLVSSLVLSSCLAVFALSISGCAATSRVFDAIEQSNAQAQERDAAAFPDASLRSVYVSPGGQPTGAYACKSCRVFFKGEDDRLDFMTIDRSAGRTHDVRTLALDIASDPIERSDVGRLFMEHARQRGNAVAVYGAPVNAQMIRMARPTQTYTQNGMLYDELSSSIVEIDRDGAYVAILAVRYEISRGLIVTDSPDAQNLFVQQRVVILPFSTARYIQERLGARFTENYRIR